MIELNVFVFIVLVLAGSYLSAYIGKAVRGDGFKRFLVAALSASALSWVFLVAYFGYFEFKPAVFVFTQALLAYLGGTLNYARTDGPDIVLYVSAVVSFSAVFAASWFSSKPEAEDDY